MYLSVEVKDYSFTPINYIILTFDELLSNPYSNHVYKIKYNFRMKTSVLKKLRRFYFYIITK
jgi:hypothetical protein